MGRSRDTGKNRKRAELLGSVILFFIAPGGRPASARSMGRCSDPPLIAYLFGVIKNVVSALCPDFILSGRRFRNSSMVVSSSCGYSGLFDEMTALIIFPENVDTFTLLVLS